MYRVTSLDHRSKPGTLSTEGPISRASLSAEDVHCRRWQRGSRWTDKSNEGKRTSILVVQPRRKSHEHLDPR